MGAAIYPSLSALAAARAKEAASAPAATSPAVSPRRRQRGDAEQGGAQASSSGGGGGQQQVTIVVVPRDTPAASLRQQLAHSLRAARPGRPAGGPTAAAAVAADPPPPLWRLLAAELAPALVFWEAGREGFLTCARMWGAAAEPAGSDTGEPAGSLAAAVRRAAALSRCHLHGSGMCVVADDASLRAAPPPTIARLLSLLAAARGAVGGTPLDWCLAMRRADAVALADGAPGVIAVLREPEHMDAM